MAKTVAPPSKDGDASVLFGTRYAKGCLEIRISAQSIVRSLFVNRESLGGTL